MWQILDPSFRLEQLGFIPSFVDGLSATPLAEQIADGYVGGYSPFGQGKWKLDGDGTLHYPDDPPFKPLARLIAATGEFLYFYDHAIAAIVQPDDGSFDVIRLD